MIKAFLTENLLVIVLIGGLSASMYWWGVHNTDLGWNARWQTRNAELSADFAAKEHKYREKERELSNDLANQMADNDSRRAEMHAVEHAAGVNLDRLRSEVADLRTRLQRAGADSSNSSSIPAATRAAMVLTDLYAGCATERLDLARAFDEARARGLAVEQMYDKARGH